MEKEGERSYLGFSARERNVRSRSREVIGFRVRVFRRGGERYEEEVESEREGLRGAVRESGEELRAD